MKSNAKLKGMFRLSHKVVAYIPSKDKEGNNLSEKLLAELENTVAGVMSDVNGGATGMDAIGYWVVPSGTTIKERIRQVYSYCTDLESCLDAILPVMEEIKQKANQDAVSLEVDNELYIL